MLINVFQILYIHLLDKMNTRNVDMKCRIIIVELKIEVMPLVPHKKIMQSRHRINVSKHGIQKNYKEV